LLLKRGASPNLQGKDRNGNSVPSPLHLAIMEGHKVTLHPPPFSLLPLPSSPSLLRP
jgi:hypothetical protein